MHLLDIITQIDAQELKMLYTINKIIVVLNNFENTDKIFEKALKIAAQQKAVLEVLYIHEKPLFDLPNYFCLENDAGDNLIDKEKIREEIKQRLSKLGFQDNCAILVFVDDTVDRVLNQTKELLHTLIITFYHEKITEKLVKKSTASFLVIKNEKKEYDKIIMPVDLSENSLKCITLAKALFSQSNIRLLHDNHFIILQESKKQDKALYETLKKETNLEGDYMQEYAVNEIDFAKELYAIEKHLAEFIKTGDFDLTILCSHHKDFLFANSVSYAMLEMLQTDLLLLKKHDERV